MEDSRFSVIITSEQLLCLDCNCPRQSAEEWANAAKSCRSCSVAWAVSTSGIELRLFNVFTEVAVYGRRIEGIIRTERQRVALTRLMALAHGHKEPLLLVLDDHRQQKAMEVSGEKERRTKLQDLLDLGIEIPPFVYVDYWDDQSKRLSLTNS